MNKGHHDATSLAVHLVEQPQRADLRTFSVSASVKDGRALFSLSNLDAESPLSVGFDLRGWGLGGVQGRLLTAPALQTHNTANEPHAVSPVAFDGFSATDSGLVVELPPHSFVTLSGQV
jgi:alpha-N-arabinofuranosidase